MEETRLRADYIGYPRYVRDTDRKMIPAPKRMFDPGSVYVTRKITIGFAKLNDDGVANPRSKGRERMVERVFRETIPFITWSIENQSEAVRRGYFLERSAVDNHATVIPLPHGPFKTDADVMRGGKRMALAGDDHSLHLCLFVLQQDQHGWSGTWENVTIARYHPQLLWYKRHVNGPAARKDHTPKPSPAERTELDDLRHELWRRSAGGTSFDAWLGAQPGHRGCQAELAYLRSALNIPTPRPRSRGRPRGTMASHLALRERQFAEWMALNTDVPFNIWCKYRTDPT
jgi:hypothetical protein